MKGNAGKRQIRSSRSRGSFREKSQSDSAQKIPKIMRPPDCHGDSHGKDKKNVHGRLLICPDFVPESEKTLIQ